MGPVHVKTELLSRERVISLPRPLKSRLRGPRLLYQSFLVLSATLAPSSFPGSSAAHRKLVLLSAVAVRNTSLIPELALNSSALSQRRDEGLYLLLLKPWEVRMQGWCLKRGRQISCV